jgi:SAM-dependent methyltransferase
MDFMQITEDLTMVNEGHVGGFIIEKDPATYTPHLWEYLCKKFDLKTVLDVGCGMGHAIEEFNKHCDEVVGVDGSKYAVENSLFMIFAGHVNLWSMLMKHIEITF